MAEVVVSQTNLLSSFHHQIQTISAFPKASGSSLSFSSKTDFHGKRIGPHRFGPRDLQSQAINSQLQPGFRIGKAHKWWEKGTQPNMKEVTSAQDLLDSLLNAGGKLVVVDFLSPGCGGCKALHPMICQFAEMNPDVLFLQVNYEEHKSMCYSLNVHVLPFFRFYRGAHGRLCSFSSTNATIKKFKDALAKHKPERCSLGPTKGLEEKELLALSSNTDLEFSYTPKQVEPMPAKEAVEMNVPAPSRSNSGALPLPSPTLKAGQIVERNRVGAGR